MYSLFWVIHAHEVSMSSEVELIGHFPKSQILSSVPSRNINENRERFEAIHRMEVLLCLSPAYDSRSLTFNVSNHPWEGPCYKREIEWPKVRCFC